MCGRRGTFGTFTDVRGSSATTVDPWTSTVFYLAGARCVWQAWQFRRCPRKLGDDGGPIDADCLLRGRRDTKRKWEAKKEYFSQYKKMAAALLALIWIRHFRALTLTTLQRIRQLKTQKLYMHVDGRQKKECTVSRGRLCLMYVMHLSTMTMQLPLAQMSNRDGEAGMETVLWDISVIPNGTERISHPPHTPSTS